MLCPVPKGHDTAPYLHAILSENQFGNANNKQTFPAGMSCRRARAVCLLWFVVDHTAGWWDRGQRWNRNYTGCKILNVDSRASISIAFLINIVDRDLLGGQSLYTQMSSQHDMLMQMSKTAQGMVKYYRCSSSSKWGPPVTYCQSLQQTYQSSSRTMVYCSSFPSYLNFFP